MTIIAQLEWALEILQKHDMVAIVSLLTPMSRCFLLNVLIIPSV